MITLLIAVPQRDDDDREAATVPAHKRRKLDDDNAAASSVGGSVLALVLRSTSSADIRRAFAVPSTLEQAVEHLKLQYEARMPLPVDEESKQMPKQQPVNITELLRRYFVFDNESVLSNIMQCARYSADPTYEYYRLAPSAIERCFLVAQCRGTQFHAYLQHELLRHYGAQREEKVEAQQKAKEQREKEPADIAPLMPLCWQFARRFVVETLQRRLGLVLLRAEWNIADTQVRGRADAVFVRADEWQRWEQQQQRQRNEEQEQQQQRSEKQQPGDADSIGIAASLSFPALYLFDWKLSLKSLLQGKEYDSPPLPPPLSDVAACVSNKYALQLALYRRLLRRRGYRVAAARVIRFDEQQEAAEMADVVDNDAVDRLVDALLQEHMSKAQRNNQP